MLYDESAKKTCIKFQRVKGYDGPVKRCAQYEEKRADSSQLSEYRKSKRKTKPTKKR
jgi:hypothetical protein